MHVPQRSVSWSQEPVLLLQGRLSGAALQVDQWFCLQQHTTPSPASPLLLVPAVEDVYFVVQLRARCFRASRAGKLKVDRVHCQAFLSKA